MSDSYPGLLSYALWAVAGFFVLGMVLFASPAGKGDSQRGQSIFGCLLFAAIFTMFGFMTQRSHSADRVREANIAVGRAQIALEEAIQAEKNAAIMNSDGNPPVSVAQNMSFSACKDRITEMAVGSGAGEAIIDAADVKSTRFHATDGSVIVTCSKPDGKMIITRSARK